MVNQMNRKALASLAAALLAVCLSAGTLSALADAWPTQLDDRIAEEGMWITWRVDEINDFYQELGFSAPLLAEAPDGMIDRDTAVAIARDFILQHVDSACPQYYYQNGMDPVPMSEDFMNSLKVAAFLTSGDETLDTSNCWHIHFYADEWLTIALDTFHVRIDAESGDIVEFFEPGGNG